MVVIISQGTLKHNEPMKTKEYDCVWEKKNIDICFIIRKLYNMLAIVYTLPQWAKNL